MPISGRRIELITDHVSDQVKNLLEQLLKGESDAAGLMMRLNLAHSQNRPTFRKNYLHPAIEANFIEMTEPESPRSPKQKYKLTEKGRSVCL
ncbi:MAG TPA: hypothetical protein VHO70_01020 [Chitinispirillaceae bacterium]|nr:hypothetical protein [Chitinispirillaceae bacterium]